MKSSYAGIAGIAGMAALVTGAGLGFGVGTAQAKPKPVVPGPHHTTMMTTHFLGAFETNVDRFIDSTYPNGESSMLDAFSDLLTPLAR